MKNFNCNFTRNSLEFVTRTNMQGQQHKIEKGKFSLKCDILAPFMAIVADSKTM